MLKPEGPLLGARGFSGDGGLGVDAQLDFPFALSVDASQNLWIADTSNRRVRRYGSFNPLRTWEDDVYPLVLRDCKGCHELGTAGYTASGDSDVSFASATNEIVLTDGLEQTSLILRKAARTGGTTHAGGTIWPSDESEYAVVLKWIQDDAPRR